jgi:hypothetical protein
MYCLLKVPIPFAERNAAMRKKTCPRGACGRGLNPTPNWTNRTVSPALEDYSKYAASHSENDLYQSWLFCGFRIQWPSSG